MANNEEAKLFVAGLPDSVTEEVLRQIFEATGGSVLNVSLPKHRETGRPRGFGFVTMSTPQEAQSARDALDGSMQGGRSISVRPFLAEAPRKSDGPMSQGPRSFGAGPRSTGGGGGAQAPDRTLYVGNLPYDTSQQEVEALVQGVAGEGQVLRVHLPTDPDGRKRGFGFVKPLDHLEEGDGADPVGAGKPQPGGTLGAHALAPPIFGSLPSIRRAMLARCRQ